MTRRSSPAELPPTLAERLAICPSDTRVLVVASGFLAISSVVVRLLLGGQGERATVSASAVPVLVVGVLLLALVQWSDPLLTVLIVLLTPIAGLVLLVSLGTGATPLLLLAALLLARSLPRPKVRSGTVTVSAGSLAIAVLAFGAAWVSAPVGSGRLEDVGSAGNRSVYFFGAVQEAHCQDEATPIRPCLIVGGADDGWVSVHGQLCPALRDRFSVDDLRRTGGRIVSEALTADGYSGARHGDVYVTGVDEERPDVETIDPSVTATWVRADLAWSRRENGAFVDSTKQAWRIDLVKERRSWRVCGFTRLT